MDAFTTRARKDRIGSHKLRQGTYLSRSIGWRRNVHPQLPHVFKNIVKPPLNSLRHLSLFKLSLASFLFYSLKKPAGTIREKRSAIIVQKKYGICDQSARYVF